MAAYVKPVIKTIETASQLFAAAGTGLVISGVPQNCRIWRVRALRSASAGVTFTEFEVIKTATTPTVAVGSSATTQLRANNAAAANPMDWTPSNPIMSSRTRATAPAPSLYGSTPMRTGPASCSSSSRSAPNVGNTCSGGGVGRQTHHRGC